MLKVCCILPLCCVALCGEC